jgi:hypothetical protein
MSGRTREVDSVGASHVVQTLTGFSGTGSSGVGVTIGTGLEVGVTMGCGSSGVGVVETVLSAEQSFAPGGQMT